MENVQSNQTLTLRPGRSKPSTVKDKSSQQFVFRDYSDQSGIQFRHVENDFIDFKDETLLPYQLSRQGPALAKGDVNKDGLEDVFIGGAIGQTAELYIQQKDGTFARSKTQSFAIDKESEDVNAVFLMPIKMVTWTCMWLLGP